MESPNSNIDQITSFPSWRLSVRKDELRLVPRSTWREKRPIFVGTILLMFCVAAICVFLNQWRDWWLLPAMGVSIAPVYVVCWALDKALTAGEPYLIVRRVEGQIELPRYRVSGGLDRLVAIGIREAGDIGDMLQEGDTAAGLFVVLLAQEESAAYDLIAAHTKEELIATSVRLSELLGVPVFFGVKGKRGGGWVIE